MSDDYEYEEPSENEFTEEDEKVLETGHNLINNLDKNSDIRDEVKRVTQSDPFFLLRQDLLSFFRNRISEIQKHDSFIKNIETSLKEDLDEGNLSFDEKMRLYKLITNQANNSQEGILSLFRPTPGAPSILAQNLSEKEEKADKYEEIFDKLSSGDLQKIDKLNKFLDKLSSEE